MGVQVVCGRILKDNKWINFWRVFSDHLYKSNSSLPPKEQMIIAWPDVVVEQLKPNKDEFIVIKSGIGFLYFFLISYQTFKKF